MGAMKLAKRYAFQGKGAGSRGWVAKIPSKSICQMRVKTRMRISTSATTTRKLLKT